MFFLVLLLAILLVVLWSKVSQHSINLRLLNSRLDLLEKTTADLARTLEELRTGARVTPEPTVSKREPAPKQPELSPEQRHPPVVKPVPPPVPPLIEPAPAVPEVAQPLTPQIPPEPAYHPPSSRPRWNLPRFDWESLVGVKLFSWIAGIALLLAIVFFLRYSINQGWLGPQVRMAIGIIVGVGLLGLCELKAARRYPVTANAMDASAIAILFSTFYAARALWDLIGPVPAFLLMVLITAIAVLLSIRRDSVFIALLGLLGGFATPALLSTGENRPLSLFTYLLLLNAGLAYVAARKKWPLLTTLSLIFTVMYQWGWVIKFLTASQLPTALGIFLVFPVLAFVAASLRRHEEPGGSWISLYGQTTNITALLPLLFTLYLSAVPGYGQRYILLFSFLFLLDAGLFVIAAAQKTEILHFIGGLSTILVCAIWLWVSYSGSAWPVLLAFIALFVLFYLAAPLIAQHFRHGFSEIGKWAVYTAPLLLFMIPALAAVEPACSVPGPLFGILFLLMLGVAAYALYAEQGAVYFLASLFALVAEAIWAYKYLSPERLVSGLALFTIFGLLFIAVPVVAGWWRKALQLTSIALPTFNGMYLGLVGHLFLVFVAAQSSLSVPPWPFFSVLLILDVAIGFSALYLRRYDLHRAAMAASAILLMIWVASAKEAPWPAVAILATGGLSLLSLAWIYLAQRSGIDRPAFSKTSGMTVILAQIVLVAATLQPGAPGVRFLLAASLLFLVALLALAWSDERHEYAFIAVSTTALAVLSWYTKHGGPEFWKQLLLLATPIYILFISYPLLLGRRSGRAVLPYFSAVLASVAFFFEARHAMIQAGWEHAIGILPVSEALLMGLLVIRLLQIEPRGGRSLGRLALVAGTALAFATVAIPLQLEKEWITIGWVLEGAALAWLYGRIPHKGLLYAATGLFAAVFARLALNPLVLTYAVRGEIPIWNWYLYTYLISAAAMISGGRLLARTRDELYLEGPRVSRIIPGAAIILLFLLLNIEIADYFSTGPTITFNFTATLAQDLTYTLAWALFAVALLATGIILRSQPARIASLALLIATIFKCFIHDLDRLGELYRVASFVGLGICLALVALALQRFVFSTRKQEK